MREYKDEAYLFTLAKVSSGKIIACRTPSGEKNTGRNIFSCLKMSEKERDFFKEASATYGNTPIVALCKGDKRETVIFFRDLIFGASLCLAVVTRFDVESVSAVLCDETLGEFLISDGVKSAKTEDFSYEKHKEVYRYLLSVVSCAERIAALKQDYEPADIDRIISCAKSAAEIAEVEAVIEAGTCEEDRLYEPAVDIFDGRICAAILLTVAMVSRYHSKNKNFKLQIERSLQSLSMTVEVRVIGDGWIGAFEYLKHICEDNRGIPFSYEFKRGHVRVTVSPFYADVSFVGVKENDNFTSLVELFGDR